MKTLKEKSLKEWRFEIAAKLNIKPESVYMRLARGNHPEVEIVRINHQRQFVKPSNHQTINRKTKPMGNNAAFTAFEHAVVNTYKRGKLDKELLKVFMEQYRDTDIDSGGKVGLFVKEPARHGQEKSRRMEVEDIAIWVMTKQFFAPPKHPKDWKNWTPEQDKANDAYHEKRDAAFHKITDKFGWC